MRMACRQRDRERERIRYIILYLSLTVLGSGREFEGPGMSVVKEWSEFGLIWEL